MILCTLGTLLISWLVIEWLKYCLFSVLQDSRVLFNILAFYTHHLYFSDIEMPSLVKIKCFELKKCSVICIWGSSQGVETSASRSHRLPVGRWSGGFTIYTGVPSTCASLCPLARGLLSLCSVAVRDDWACAPPAVPGLRHGGVPRQDSARRRQLPGDPRAATGGDDADPRADLTSPALQPSGSQYGAELNSEGQNLRSACVQVKS